MANALMDIQFDPALVEEAVFLKIKGMASTDLLVRSFHQQREALYGGKEPGSTDEKAFEDLYQDYFSRTGLEELMSGIVKEFEHLSQPGILIFFKKVDRRKQQRVQLYCQGQLKTVFIGLQAALILNESQLKDHLRYELMHVEDMLDPLFQYTPDPVFGGATEIEDWLIRDRFCQLWDLYVHLRLKGQKVTSELGKGQQGAIGQFVEAVCTGTRYSQEELLSLTRGLRTESIKHG